MKNIRKDNFPVPNKEDIKKAIENSGYVFELQLCPIFEKFEYITQSADHFQDQDTGKSREIDIHASKYIWSNYQLHPDDIDLILSDTLCIDIIAECKNNRAPVVFFTRKPSLKHYAELLVAGNPEMIKNVEGIPDDGLVDIQDFLKFEEFHHHWKVIYPSYQFGLMKPKYQGKGSKQEIIEWTMTHEDYYESLEKLVKAAFAKGQEAYEASMQFEIDEVYLSIIYPMLILSGDIYECRVTQNTYELYKINHLLLQWQTKSSTISLYANIDVVSSSYLARFLKKLDIENKEIAKRISSNLDMLKASVTKKAESKFSPRKLVNSSELEEEP